MSEVKTNKISSLDSSNSDITLDPDGTGDVVVAAGHKLGAGTASPSSALHVYDGSNAKINMETSTNTAFIGNISGSMEMQSADIIKFLTGGANEAVRIDTSGQFMANFGQTTDIDGNIGASSGNTTFGVQKTDGIRIAQPGSSYWNKFSDGVIVNFRSAGTTEGNIQVSGTTVSYVGGNLARWSQLADVC